MAIWRNEIMKAHGINNQGVINNGVIGAGESVMLSAALKINTGWRYINENNNGERRNERK
jgi:hypothetical protein